MGLFDFFKKKCPSSDDQVVVDDNVAPVEQIVKVPSSQPLSAEAYNQIRQREMDWLEKHYDFNSLPGINSIPVSRNLKRPPGDSTTGEVYYYLKFKARKHEEDGNIELAIACFQKSISLMRLRYGSAYGQEESYSFVRMLARNGYLEEATQTKAETDYFYNINACRKSLACFQEIRQQAKELNTDLVIMSVHGSVCPECAKYQGRVFSLSGKNKIFPQLPNVIATTGNVHPGCGHTFFPYIHKVTDPQLDYTLSVHPLEDKSYGKNIVTFSNRPFVDDRTAECKQAALAVRENQREDIAKKKLRDDTMIEREYQKWLDNQTLDWLRVNFPDKCPKNITSFRRMRTQNTKNYQMLKQLAAERGKEI